MEDVKITKFDYFDYSADDNGPVLLKQTDRGYEPVLGMLWWSYNRNKWWKLVDIGEKYDSWIIIDNKEMGWYFGYPDALFNADQERMRIKVDLLDIMGDDSVSRTKMAKAIGISYVTLSKFLKGERALSKKAPALQKIKDFIEKHKGKNIPFHYW